MDFAHAAQSIHAQRGRVLPTVRRAAAAYAQQVGAMLSDMANALKDMEQTPDVSVKHYSYAVPATEATR